MYTTENKEEAMLVHKGEEQRQVSTLDYWICASWCDLRGVLDNKSTIPAHQQDFSISMTNIFHPRPFF